jgi:CheY-like chemotaxis protein
MINKSLGTFGSTAKGLSKNPLGIIALFIVLVYGFASLVTVFASSFTAVERLPLIYFLVVFPVLVLGVFGWLVSCHSGKLYSPGDYQNEDNYMRMQLTAATALAAAAASAPGASSNSVDFAKIAETVKLVSSNDQTHHVSWQKRILWVDDRPENNVYLRKAFEAFGLSISIALSTSEAMETLKYNKFAAIISDMGRREGPREGYVLLENIRNQGNKTPFFIYAGSNLPEHKREAVENGAQGSTNNSEELFSFVTEAVLNKAN